MTRQASIRFPDSLREQIAALAVNDRRTFSSAVIVLVEDALVRAGGSACGSPEVLIEADTATEAEQKASAPIWILPAAAGVVAVIDLATGWLGNARRVDLLTLGSCVAGMWGLLNTRRLAPSDP